LLEDHAKVISTMLVEMLKRAKNGENYTHGNHFGWRKTSPNSFEYVFGLCPRQALF